MHENVTSLRMRQLVKPAKLPTTRLNGPLDDRRIPDWTQALELAASAANAAEHGTTDEARVSLTDAFTVFADLAEVELCKRQPLIPFSVADGAENRAPCGRP